MSACIVFIDGEHAKFFHLNPGKIETQVIKKSHHATHTAGTNHDEHSKQFYHEVAAQLKSSSEILIIGPGVAKSQFKHHLENHHHADIAKKVVGVENADHPTDAQIKAAGRQFFKTYDLFH
jgi:stalled ribosome rescue protein Dom34